MEVVDLASELAKGAVVAAQSRTAVIAAVPADAVLCADFAALVPEEAASEGEADEVHCAATAAVPFAHLFFVDSELDARHPKREAARRPVRGAAAKASYPVTHDPCCFYILFIT